MQQEPRSPAHEAWRIVVVTNIPGGLVYGLVGDVIRPLGHRIIGVVTASGPPRRRSADYLDVVAAVAPDVDVIVSNHPSRWAAMLAPLRPDLIVCGGMPWRIPEDVVALARLGAINCHPALLPRHRGPWPFHRTFRCDDAETGFTVHRIAPAFDAGPILAQARVSIADDDDVGSLLGKMEPLLPDLLRTALARVAQGDPGDPQDESLATPAGFASNEERIIDWHQPARNVHNLVRAWVGGIDGPDGAVGDVDGSRLVVTKTRLLPGEPTGGALPGTVLRRDVSTLVVACGDAPLALVEWSEGNPNRVSPSS